MNNIAVIYLCYVPYGTTYLEDFLFSYKKQSSGVNHELIIVFNGYLNISELEIFLNILKKSSLNYHIEMTDAKYDIDVYYYIAKKLINFEYFLFFNTYTQILSANWLYYYLKIINEDNVGCVSATGAWGDFQHLIEYRNAINRLLKFNIKFNDLKKIVYFRYNFYPSVDIHLRTNAFFIKRSIFLSIQRPNVKPFLLRLLLGLNKKKLRSFCFEHGSNSFSKQLIKKGYKIKIVNKLGEGLESEFWASSNVFWNGEQENLLIKDNQTNKYFSSSIENRKKLIYAAWGFQSTTTS